MNSLALNEDTLALATNCVLIGHGHKADCVWTRDAFLTICKHMMNDNPPTDFLLVYRDKEDRAKYGRSKTQKAERRASWSWDTITGRAKHKVGIGFYPSNPDGNTRWAAMDFDAHDGDGQRARNLAYAAFDLLHRQPQLYVVLGTSGSEGWHLFAFTREFHPVGDWTLLLKQVARHIGAEVKSGLCEIFPNETKNGALPYPIRAPGTWNPKTDSCGLIFHSSVERFLPKGEGKSSPFLYHATNRVKEAELHDTEKPPLYRGPGGTWEREFAITAPSTRHERLKTLVHTIYRQVGHSIAQANAEAQHREATPCPQASEAEHLKEFEDLWRWTDDRWRSELSAGEMDRLACLSTEAHKDAFRIVRNFARYATEQGDEDFPVAVENLGDRLGISYQAASKIRKRFSELGIITQTAPARANVSAARFYWLASSDIDQPF